ADRQPRRAPQRSDRVSEIRQHLTNLLAAAPVRRYALVDGHEIIPHLPDVTELVFGLATRPVRRRPECDQLFDTRLEVEAKLVVDVAGDRRSDEPQVPSPRRSSIRIRHD